jgi:hypothetical protein
MALVVAALSFFALAPPHDQGHGLRATFFANSHWREPAALHKEVVRRLDISMDGNLASSNQSNYSVRWEGFLRIDDPGKYDFLLDSDDGSVLWIDGKKIVENGGTHVRRQRERGIHLSEGEHEIKLQYSQGVGNSFFRFRFKPPGESSWECIPLARLTPVEGSRFDRKSVDRSNRNRIVLFCFGVLLLSAALAHLVVFRWNRIGPVFRDAGVRKELAGRIMRSAVTHDVICVLLCLGFYLQTIAVRYPHEPYLQGDSPYYANTAVSILMDFDLDQRNQSDPDVFEKPQRWTNIGMYDSNIARGSAGEWYPKHTLVLPFLSVPFYAVFGGIGFLVFNVVILLLMVVVIRRVAWLYAGPGAASIAAVLIGISPMFHHFAYSYSADILAAVLLVGGLGATLTRRGLAAGFLLGLSVWVKIPNGIGLVLAGLLLLVRKDWRTFWWFCGGAFVSMGLFAGFNWYQFGAPWMTSYSQVWVIENGISKIGDHVSSFDYPFWDGMRLQLVDGVHGLIPTAGVSLLAIFGYGRLFKKDRAAFALILLFSAITFLFYCKYDFITGSHYANRFLMPVVALSVVPLACLLEWLTGQYCPTTRKKNPP